MIERIVIGMVISFILRQLEKFNKTIDWEKVKSDLAVRVAALVPGTWFDAEAVAAVNAVVDAVACAMKQTGAFDEIMKLLADQKWSEAANRLKQLILDVWTGGSCPSTPKAEELVAAGGVVEAVQPV